MVDTFEIVEFVIRKIINMRTLMTGDIVCNWKFPLEYDISINWQSASSHKMAIKSANKQKTHIYFVYMKL